MKNTKKILSLCLLLMSIFPYTGNAQFSITTVDKKSNEVNYEIAPGETIIGKAVIRSYTDKEIDIGLYGADGTQTDRGAFTLAQPYLKQSNVGLWINLPKTSITIDPKKTTEFEYSITVPGNATPGTYGGGIAATNSPNKNAANSTSGGASIVSSTRMLFPIFITVPGEKIVKYSWDEFTYGTESNNHIFYLKIKNEGNTTIAAEGKIEINGWPYFETKTLYFNKITLFGKDEVLVPINWNDQPLLGFFDSKATLTFYEHNAKTGEEVLLETINKTTTFSVIPWLIIGVILLFIALALLVKVGLYLQEKNLIKSCTKYTIKDGDTLQGLAEKTSCSWEKIAKINGLKPPYTLKKGNDILLPQKKA